MSRTDLPTLAGTPYGGGIYAGRYFIGDRAFALIVAPAETGELATTTWGKINRVTGAESYVDGLANTEAMAASGSALAQWARALRIGDCDDWYIPSRLEALLAFGELQSAFQHDWYWTSTQYASIAGDAWLQSFGFGTQNFVRKDNELRARAVRRLVIE